MFGLNRKSKTQIGDLRVLFYTDAAVHGSHGRIKVSHRKHNLRECVVNFVFVGPSTAPELTPTLIAHIWQEAYAQGYIPHALVGCLEDNVPLDQVHPGVTDKYDVPSVFRAGRVAGRNPGNAPIPGEARPTEYGHKTQGFDTAARLAEQVTAA